MNENADNKEKEELLKKMKELLEKLGKSDNENKASLIEVVLGVMILLLNVAEKGTKQIGNEIKSVSA
jgi:hypothetical protein